MRTDVTKMRILFARLRLVDGLEYGRYGEFGFATDSTGITGFGYDFSAFGK